MPKITGVDISNITKRSGVSSFSKASGITLSSGSTSLLLDTYTGAKAAYSVRHLNSQYTGACMRVREGGGNTETDIGFDSNGYLDTAAIATHCGSAVGYVTKWYSQATAGSTGGGNDAVQGTYTQQPRIYSGAAPYTDNGVAAVEFPNVSNGDIGFDLQTNIRSTLGPSSVIFVSHIDQQFSSGYQRIASLYNCQQPVWGSTAGDANYGKLSVGNSSSSGTRKYVKWNSVPNRLDQKVWATTYDGTTRTPNAPDIRLFVNAVENTVHADGLGGFYVPGTGENSIGYRKQNNSQGIDGTIQEFLIYDSDKSGVISGISTDMQNYFSIT